MWTVSANKTADGWQANYHNKLKFVIKYEPPHFKQLTAIIDVNLKFQLWQAYCWLRYLPSSPIRANYGERVAQWCVELCRISVRSVYTAAMQGEKSPKN